MVQAKDVESLNKRIEDLNTKRTKAETRQEVLLSKLQEEIESYKESYGVNLNGKNYAEISKKVSKEAKEVTSQVEEEYKLKLQVVQAIDDGDYEKARKLLGEEVEESVEDDFDMDEDAAEDAGEEIVEDSEESEESAEEDAAEDADEDFDEDFDDYDDSFAEDGEDDAEDDEEDSFEDGGENSFEDDEEELPMPSNFLKAVKNATKAKEAEKKPAKKEIEGKSVKETMSALSAGIMLEDDDDEIDDDFGFGDMLAGTKFDS